MSLIYTLWPTHSAAWHFDRSEWSSFTVVSLVIPLPVPMTFLILMKLFLILTTSYKQLPNLPSPAPHDRHPTAKQVRYRDGILNILNIFELNEFKGGVTNVKGVINPMDDHAYIAYIFFKRASNVHLRPIRSAKKRHRYLEIL